MRSEDIQNAPSSPLNHEPFFTYLHLTVLQPEPKNRRCFLAAAAASGAVLLGCTPRPEAAPSATSARRDVPLRVLLCGTQRWADLLTTAWSAIAEQPLQINLLDDAVIDASQWQSQVITAMASCDVAIVPAGLLPAINNASGLTPPNEELLSDEGIDADSLYPVLREGLMRFGGRTVAVPLGAVQPALVIRNDGAAGEIEPPRDWDGFITAAKQFSDSQVAEPLADGAAAKMYLWRANAAQPPVWLFDRQSFAPVIDTPPYVDVLETMQRCAQTYGGARLTAGQVWSQIASGGLRMAIAWPAAHSDEERIEEASGCSFASLPTAGFANAAPPQTLVDHQSPVAIISSHCRQSEAAKRFLTWVLDGEGTDMIGAAVTGVTEVRSTAAPSAAQAKLPSQPSRAERSLSSYSAQAREALSALTLRPPLQLLEYRQYAAALDAAVLSCLDGEQSAQAAMSQAAEEWAALTTRIGVKAQHQAWRRAQGLSG